MSGGSFDYACYKTMQFADELRNKLDTQGKDTDGSGWTRPKWSSAVADKLNGIADMAEHVGFLMKEAEWLYSGDTGEETFLERLRDIESERGVLLLSRIES